MEEVDGGQAATPDAVGWDGSSLTPGHARAAHNQDGGEPPALHSTPTPTRKREEPRGDSALRVQDRWGPHKTVCPHQPLEGGPGWRDPAQPWGSHGPSSQELCGGLGAALHPSAERVQPPACQSWEPFPQAHRRHLPGGPPAPGGGTSSPASYYASFMGRNFFLCCLVSC